MRTGKRWQMRGKRQPCRRFEAEIYSMCTAELIAQQLFFGPDLANTSACACMKATHHVCRVGIHRRSGGASVYTPSCVGGESYLMCEYNHLQTKHPLVAASYGGNMSHTTC